MKYSKKIQSLISKGKIGDEILIESSKGTFFGTLMPRPEIGDKDSLIIKLKNGYNIGIKSKNIRSVKVIKKMEEKKAIREIHFDKSKPNISLFVTGGTIASKIDYDTGAVKALMNPQEILDTIPELSNIVNIADISRPFTKMSEDMEPNDWISLAKGIYKKIENGSKGIIVTHGTDTLHYTSAALSFFLQKPSVPIVLVGAQRSSDRPSTDAHMNLICSAYTSLSDISEVGICMHATMNDDYCYFIRGTKVRKMHTSRRDAFRPINDLPLAKIWPNGKIEKLQDYHKRGGKTILDTKFDNKVALLKTYPGSNPGIMKYLIDKGYHGFVLEGTGLGHVPTNSKNSWIPIIKKSIKDGIPVVVTSQTIYGRVNPNVYTNLRVLYHESKAIPGEDMLSETAYIKLGWVLGHTKDMDKIREMMLTNVSGEINSRSNPKTFLW